MKARRATVSWMHKLHNALLSLPDLADRALGRLDDFFDRRRARRGSDLWLGLFLLSPALTLLGVFAFIPLVSAFYMSLFDQDLISARFVGFGKYAIAFADPAFWSSVRVTLYYSACVVPLTMTLSFFIANALHRALWGRGFFRTLFFLPYVTSAVASALVWRAIFSHPRGVANLLLEHAGLPAQQWLIEERGLLHIITGGLVPESAGPSLALCCVILFDIWHTSGFMIIVFLAGLTAIPRELEEAARIDGAGALQVMRRVTLPLLSPTLFFLGIIGVIRAFQSFNSFYALTWRPDRGVPAGTTNMILFIYKKLYEQHDFGYGAAVAVLFTTAIVALTILQWRFVGRRVHYS